MRGMALLMRCAGLTVGAALGLACGDGLMTGPSLTGSGAQAGESASTGDTSATATGGGSGEWSATETGGGSGSGAAGASATGSGGGSGSGSGAGGASATGSGGGSGSGSGAAGAGATGSGAGSAGAAGGGSGAVGNPDGHCAIPAEAQLVDTSSPTRTVGNGTAASCTSDAFVEAVAAGGVITFRCGAEPVTITLDRTAKVVNDKGPEIVIDGGNLVTLSGGGRNRILYMNTCDKAQTWTTDHCQNQDHPRLTLQNLTFADGNSKSETDYDGGGAVWVRGGRLKVVHSRFVRNVCADTGPDVGGAGIRAFDQYNGLPVYVVNSTFGGRQGDGNVCSNGGGISSIGVSWTVVNSLFSYNQAIGNGGNPAESGSPGGGSGGAIYNDGNKMTLSLCGTRIEHNEVKVHGSAIFFVSNDHSGNVVIDQSTITGNLGGSWYPTYPQISNHSDTPITVTSSTVE